MHTDLLEGYYTVCHFCKSGKFLQNTEEQCIEFTQQHSKHGSLEIILATQFLSEKLSEQYIDVDRENLKPISTTIGLVEKKDLIEEFKTKRRMRLRYLNQDKKQEINPIQEVIMKFQKPFHFFIIKFEPKIFTKEELLIPQPISTTPD